MENEGPERLIDRMRWFREGRLGPDGEMPPDARNRALTEMESNIKLGILGDSPVNIVPGDGWSPVGPAPISDTLGHASYTFSGRITAIAVHPIDANVAYIGGAQGGVWKTTDHGATWAQLTDTQQSLAIGSIAIDPSNPNVVYAGTGEANFSCDSYFGAGILKSFDGGATWSLIGTAPFGNTSVSRIIVHPFNSNVLWAANTAGIGGFLCAGTPAAIQLGVWKSTDAGTTWTRVLSSTQTGVTAHTHDLAIDPSNANVLYAGVYKSGVWKTQDGGATWARLATGLPAPSAIGRVAVAIDPVTPLTLYSVFDNVSNDTQYGTYKSIDGGANWSLASANPSGSCQYWNFGDICTYSGDGFGQCWYDLVIGVASDHSVWLGGTGIWRSSTGGASWTSICPQYVHVDQHAIAFRGGDVWLGNDGGVFTTSDSGATWTSRNPGLQLTQFYPGAALHATNGSFAIGGAQDNGPLKYSGSNTWDLLSTGDGSFSAIDFTNPNNVWYISTQYLNIRKTTDGGASFSAATTGLTDAGTNATSFISPFVMCPNNAQVLVAGSNNVWRTTNGAGSWFVNSPDPLDGGSFVSTLAFAASTLNCDTYYAGDAAGRVFRTTNAGGSWTNITGGLPALGVNDLVVDPRNAAIVIAGLSGFGARHVWRTTNALDPVPTWTSIDPGIPDTPVNAVLIDPDDSNVIYLGTDVGVFRSTNGAASWSRFMGGHPNVAVFDLQANSATHTIMSFTHGRGVFRLGTFCDDGSACTTDSYDQLLGCQHVAVNCDDANICTIDSCDPQSGCVHTITTVCTDNNPCTLGDVCTGGVCVPGSAALPSPGHFCNNSTISIPDFGASTPYPSSIVVTGQPSYVCSATVDLNGITHTWPDDIDILLARLTGNNATIMSDVGGSADVFGLNLTLNDAAASVLPDLGPLVSGTFQPTNVNDGSLDSVPAAPTPSGGSALATFVGTNPNGTWNLWVYDDTGGDSGSMAGWCVNLVSVCGSDAACDDADACTNDACVNGQCVHTSSTNTCDDGNACTVDDICHLNFWETFDGVTAPALPAGWVAGGTGTPWATVSTSSDSAPNSAFTDDMGFITDKTVDTPPIAIASASAQLTFRNRFTLESTYDGGVLEISIGGGAFTDILAAGGSFATGGYTGTISSSFGSPIAGRSAWTGTSTGYPNYLTTTVNLPPAAAGQSVVLRWRVATDNSVSGIGQYIDTVVLADRTGACAGTPIHPAVCEDFNPCTDDGCDPQVGCVHANNANPCSDANACTANDVCGGGVCVGGPPPALPTPTSGLTIQPGKLAWAPIPNATGYDVVRGDLGSLRTSGGNFATATQECLADDQASTSLNYAGIPAPGSGFFFLVRGSNCSGSGTYDTGSPYQVASRDAGVEAAPITCSTFCTREKCVQGPPTDSGCGGCVSSICAVDPFCCNVFWDSICVSEVRTVCSSLTCGESAGICSHTVCSQGGTLVSGCDDPPVTPSCVSTICASDPFCCFNQWDSLCVGEVAWCGYNCN